MTATPADNLARLDALAKKALFDVERDREEGYTAMADLFAELSPEVIRAMIACVRSAKAYFYAPNPDDVDWAERRFMERLAALEEALRHD